MTVTKTQPRSTDDGEEEEEEEHDEKRSEGMGGGRFDQSDLPRQERLDRSGSVMEEGMISGKLRGSDMKRMSEDEPLNAFRARRGSEGAWIGKEGWTGGGRGERLREEIEEGIRGGRSAACRGKMVPCEST